MNLGGFDKVRALTPLQGELLAEAMNEEIKMKIRLAGGTVEEEKGYRDFSEGFKAMAEALGAR